MKLMHAWYSGGPKTGSWLDCSRMRHQYWLLTGTEGQVDCVRSSKQPGGLFASQHRASGSRQNHVEGALAEVDDRQAR